MHKRNLGKLEVSVLGLGCMGMSEFYGQADESSSMETIQKAFEHGITFFDTADMYGFGDNEKLLGKAIKGFRDKIIIATKFGIVRKKEDPQFRQICGKPEYIIQQCEKSLKNLGIEAIDLYYQHRVDPDTPIEETVQAMAKLVKQGKIKHIGLSEAPKEIIERAHSIHAISALQSEYSLWNREPEDNVLPLCKKLNIGFVAYSPIGRGFLSGKIKSSNEFAPDDFRRTLPRFQGENFSQNLQIVERVKEFAAIKKCTPAQLSLAWVLAQGPHFVPLFGTTKPKHLKENIESAKITLTENELKELNEKMPAPKGDRYGPSSMNLYKFKK